MAWVWAGLEQHNQGVFNHAIINGWKAKQAVVNNNNPFKCH